MKLKDAPIGTRLVFGTMRDGDIIWRKVSENQDFFSETECGRKAFDTAEYRSNSRARRNHGNNFFPQSNIMQWLNSKGENWFHITHPDDNEPTYSCEMGFLSSFSEAELSAIVNRDISIAVPLGSRKEFGKEYSMSCAVCLPSASEAGFRLDEGQDDIEGDYLPEITVLRRDASYISMMTRTWTTDAGHILAYDQWEFIRSRANRLLGVHPMIRLIDDLEITDQPDDSGVRYVVQDNSQFILDFFNILSN